MSSGLNNFKSYLKKHPDLILKVRRGETTWQALYDEWLLVEQKDSRGIEFDQILNTVKEKIQDIDPGQIEEYSKRIQSGLDFFQEMLTKLNQEKNEPDDILMKQWKQ